MDSDIDRRQMMEDEMAQEWEVDPGMAPNLDDLFMLIPKLNSFILEEGAE